MSRLRIAPLLLALACAPKVAQAPPQVVVLPPAPSPAGPSPISAVLSGLDYVVLLPTDQQRDELTKASEAFERDRLPSDRVRLAMLLTMADPSLRDVTRAKALLQDAPFDADQGAYEALARLVLAVIAEREGRAADVAAVTEQLSAERTRRRELEEKVLAFEELERRVEALKALETAGARP